MSTIQRSVLVVAFLIPLCFAFYFYNAFSELYTPHSPDFIETPDVRGPRSMANLAFLVTACGSVGVPIAMRMIMYLVEGKLPPRWLYVAAGSVWALGFLFSILGYIGVI